MENAAVKPSMKHFKTNCRLKIHPETLLLSYCHESKAKLMIRHNFEVFGQGSMAAGTLPC